MPPDDRMTRGPPARSPDACPPARFRSSRDPPLHFWREWPDLHGTGRGCWAAGCPIEGCVKRGKFQDCESSHLLLGVGKRAILDTPLSIFNPNRGPGLGHLQGIAADINASVDEGLVVCAPSAGVGVGSIAVSCRKSFG